MATKTRIIFGCIALVLIVLLAGIVYAGFTDLVYSTGRQQISQLTAQSGEGQRILDAYYAIQAPQAFMENFATTELCKKAGDLCQKYTQIRGIITTISSSTSYLENPTGFATQMMQQQLCQQEAGACNAYTQGMSMYGQAQGATQDAWGTAENFAMGQVMSKLSPEVGQKLSMVYMARGYLDTLRMDEGSSFGGSSDEAESSTDEATDSSLSETTGMAVQEDSGMTGIKTENMKAGKCVIGFNLDGTFGDIYNCKTQQVTDVSKLAGMPAGSLLAGKDCFISKSGEKFYIKTEDEGASMDSPAVCLIKIGANPYKNFVSGRIRKGPEGNSINSATFVFEEGKLSKAEFMVAREDTEYVFGDRKYKLAKGTTLLYENNEVKLGFDYTTEPFQIFGFNQGQWVSDGIVIPDAVGSVDVQPAPRGSDYNFLIRGNFRLQTASERLIVAKGTVYYTDENRIKVGENSDAAFMSSDGGARVLTRSQDITLTRCGSRGNNAIDFCDRQIYASGSDFSFSEVRGLMSGDVSEISRRYGVSRGYLCSFNSVQCSEAEERQLMLPGERCRVDSGIVSLDSGEGSAEISGDAGCSLSGVMSMQGSLIVPVENSIEELGMQKGILQKLGAYVKERGLMNFKADIASIGIAPAIPDVLK
ncbi:MAG: hypothetical protein PHO02_06890, partial [Candidatus Nanoarchaeia archaeon]|nr:hypothetical protein [Candidatus Nanoarchaeia archaeon]